MGWPVHPCSTDYPAHEQELIEAAVSVCKQAKVAVFLLPGIVTMKELKQAADLGVKMARIATHVTEADVSAQHIALSKELGLETVGFLMMAHMAPVEKLVEQAKLMEFMLWTLREPCFLMK